MTIRIRAFTRGDLEASSQLTEEAFADGWFPVDWNWRYLEHPMPVDMWVLESDGEVIGFWSAVPRRIRFGPDLVAGAVALGDFVVDPKERGRGVGKEASAEIAHLTVDAHPDAVLMVAWARIELIDAVYDPAVGAARIPRDVIRYTYQRTWERTVERLVAVGSFTRARVRYEASGMEALVVGPGGPEVGDSLPADATIRLHRRTIGIYRGSRVRRYFELLRATLRGDIWPVGPGSWKVLLRERRRALANLLIVLRG